MFIHFFVFSLGDENIVNICRGKNTIIGESGKCECVSGFEFGDPNNEGCYTCNKACHEYASCIFPGECRCNDGYFGDGENLCVIPRPIIVNRPPSALPSSGGSEISVQLKPFEKFHPKNGFCMVGRVIFRAFFVNSSLIRCITLKQKEGTKKFSVSFNNETWSTESIYIDFYSLSKPRRSQNFGILVLISIVVIVCYFLIFIKINPFTNSLTRRIPKGLVSLDQVQ